MPTYDYECQGCQRVFEVRQRISAPPLERCETCGGTVRRLLSAAPFILKGSGWYVTDYPSESRKKALESEKKAEPATSGASTSSSTGTAAPGGSATGAAPAPAPASSTA